MGKKIQKHTEWIYVLFFYYKCLLTEADSTLTITFSGTLMTDIKVTIVYTLLSGRIYLNIYFLKQSHHIAIF